MEYIVDNWLSGITIPLIPDLKPKDRQQLLGPFHKEGVDLPFSGDQLDIRLFDDEITPIAEIIKEKNNEFHAILLGKSGDGKVNNTILFF